MRRSSSADELLFDDSPIVGWRAWDAVMSPSGLRLRAVTYLDEVWEPGRQFEARCLRPRGPEHSAPGGACQCGIHAVTSHADLPAWLTVTLPGRTAPRIVGQVSVWGRIVKHERGVRAQFGYPYSLGVPSSTPHAEHVARQLAQTYGVDAVVTGAEV